MPKNVKARLAYDVPRAMYAEYIAPVMKKIREEREAKKTKKKTVFDLITVSKIAA